MKSGFIAVKAVPVGFYLPSLLLPKGQEAAAYKRMSGYNNVPSKEEPYSLTSERGVLAANEPTLDTAQTNISDRVVDFFCIL